MLSRVMVGRDGHTKSNVSLYWAVCTHMDKLLAIKKKQSCSVTTARSDTYHYPGEFIMRYWEKKSTSQAHLIDDCRLVGSWAMARVSQWHTFISFSKSAADGRGPGGEGVSRGCHVISTSHPYCWGPIISSTALRGTRHAAAEKSTQRWFV